MLDPVTSDDRRRSLRLDLLAYCALDTEALVMLAQALAGA